MAAYSGKNGTVTGPTGVTVVTKFSATHKGAVTTFGHSGGSGWKAAVDGTEEVAGDIEGKVSGTTPIQRGTSVAIVLNTGQLRLSGNAMISEVAYECDIDTGAPVSFKASFVSDGVWTIGA